MLVRYFGNYFFGLVLMRCISVKIMIISVRQKKMVSLSACFPTLSQNEKIFAEYEKRFSHNE